MKRESWKKLWPFSTGPAIKRTTIKLEGKLVVLRSKTINDVNVDYQWRTDPELAALDASTPLNMSLKEYARFHRDEIEFPSPWSVRFGIDVESSKFIGNCMYYDIDWDRKQAELGIMIGDKDYWNFGYGTDAVITLLEYVFTNTRLDCIYLHTLTSNKRAQKAFKKAGFYCTNQIKRDDYRFQRMEINRSFWNG